MRRARPVGLCLLVAVGYAVTPHAVALYDGLNFPDQPYRFLTPAAGQGGRTAPTGAAGSSSMTFGVNAADIHLASSESGPQVVVDFPAGSLLDKVAASVRASVTPVPADVGPPEGRLDGNVYRLALTADAGALRLSPDGSAYLYLRAAALTSPLPHVDFRPAAGGPWQKLVTDRIGNDVFSAPVTGPGDYAVVQVAGAKAGSSGSGSRLILLIGGIVVLLALGVLGLRRTSGRGAEGEASA